MPGFIPREKLTAYQRWELAAFDAEEDAAAEPGEAEAPLAADEPSQVDVSEEPEESAITLPTAADIERIHNEAREQGYTEGYTEGYAAGQATGHSEGYAAGQMEGETRAQEIAARMAEILENLEQDVGGIEQSVADRLLATAVEIANQVVRQSLSIKPELLLPVVREAVEALQFSSGHPALLAHPDDAALIRERLGDHLTRNHWRIIDDPSLTRGGCRVELGASEVDATLETRWKRVMETLGSRRDWLDD